MRAVLMAIRGRKQRLELATRHRELLKPGTGTFKACEIRRDRPQGEVVSVMGFLPTSPFSPAETVREAVHAADVYVRQALG